ncbi:MAG: hypothetical protein ACYC64_11530 [Armatimonadota bacterium]
MCDKPEPESLRLAMDEAWRVHQHTRDQTWKALQIEFALAVGVVGAAWQNKSLWVMVAVAIFVLIAALCGVQITLRHRNSVEVRKFHYIHDCEKKLGLPISGGVPSTITIWDAFRIWDVFLNVFRFHAVAALPPELAETAGSRDGNTALFILRMHLAIMAFAIFLLIYRLVIH